MPRIKTAKTVPQLRKDNSGSSPRLHGAIARDLGIAIVSGRHKPGDALGNEIELSEHLQVSRSVYREAIRILAAKGMVTSRPRAGTRVVPMSQWNLLDPDVLSWFFETEPSAALVNSLLELRMIVEPAAAAFAAQRRSKEQLERMRTALSNMERLTLKTAAGQSADREFHQIVLEASGNLPLASLGSAIGATVGWTTLYKQRRRKPSLDLMPEHWAVFRAIAARDFKVARKAMETLVTNSLHQIQGHLRKG